MSYFLFDGELSLGKSIVLDGPEGVHLLQSRRIRKGERVLLQDAFQKRYLSEVINIQRKELTLCPLEQVQPPDEPKTPLWLCLAMIKEKALDFTLQKATELGVTGILLFESERSQRLPKEREQASKLERWNRILQEAAKQSERLSPPELLVKANPDFTQLEGVSLVLHTSGDRRSLAELELDQQRINLIIGPEGGFAEHEMEGLTSLALGPRILRADTAAISAISITRFLLGDLGQT